MPRWTFSDEPAMPQEAPFLASERSDGGRVLLINDGQVVGGAATDVCGAASERPATSVPLGPR